MVLIWRAPVTEMAISSWSSLAAPTSGIHRLSFPASGQGLSHEIVEANGSPSEGAVNRNPGLLPLEGAALLLFL